MDSEFRTYLIANGPQWLLLAILAWIAERSYDVPWWMGAGLVAVWVLKDLLLFPVMRHYYRPVPSERRIVGTEGIALSQLSPRGFVRVHGEIWQAEAINGALGEILEGTRVRVRDVRGLLVLVEPV
jgi:membrane protein implicated in regulation of membrane protease activity